MPILTLADLVSPVSQADALSLELSIATTLGLQTSTWQPLDPSRTILQINATVVANYASTVNLIAQGGYASYAALMTDSTGAPITSWMDLISNDNYNVPRIQATIAAGPVPYSNSSATSYSYTPNAPLKFQNPLTPNATYTSTGSGTLTGSGSGTVSVAADAAFVGPQGNAAIGTRLILLTPKSGVTISPQTVALVGAPQESNTALLARDQAKLGTLSGLTQLAALTGSTASVPAAPGGSPLAYYFVATTIPQASVASAVWPYAVTSPMTRVGGGAVGGGAVDVYLANSAGAPPSTDVAAVRAAIRALCVPQGTVVTVSAAVNRAIPVTYTVYVPAGGPLSVATIQANINNALLAYFAALPVGGVPISVGHVVPFDAIVGTIWAANGGTIDVELAAPLASTPISAFQVPVLGTVTGTVVQV